MIERFIDILRNAGLEDITAEEVAEMILLADVIPPLEPNPTADDISHSGKPDERQSSSTPQLPVSGATAPQPETANAQLPQAGVLDLSAKEAAEGEVEGEGVEVAPFRAPRANPLPGEREILRALRPLRRRHPSTRRFILDEEKTIRRIADGGPISLALQPAPEAWLDVALVFDESVTMRVWRQTLDQLRRLFERCGYFRDVRAWRLNTEAEKAILYRATEAPGVSRQRHRPGELLDPSGRRLIVVVSDCHAPAWLNGSAYAVIHEWAMKCPVALVQALPEPFWAGTTMTPVDAALRMPKSAVANRLLQIAQQPYRRVIAAGGVPLPVVTLDEWAIAPWARAVSGATGVSVSGLVIPPPKAMARALAAKSLQEKRNDDQSGRPTAVQRVEHFLNSSASKEAKQLVRYLAAAPLSLPVMQLVQQAMLPEARQSHLAEVFLSGLLYQSRSHRNPDEIIYEFYDGVREELRRFVTEAETVRVIYEVSRYIQNRIGETSEFAAGLAIPASGGAVKRIDPLCLRFATLSADILRRFGRYQETVAKLEGLAKSERSETEVVTKPPKEEKRENDRSSAKKSLRAAIVIGVNQYDDTKLPKLKNCVNDAIAVSESLTQYGYRVSLLTDEKATRENIIDSLDAISGFSVNAPKNSLLLFHFSGHSFPIDGKTYLFPRDWRQSNGAATGIPVIDIIDSLSRSSVEQKIIILDGSEYGDDLVDMSQNTANLALITSALPGQKVYDIGPDNHSPFTYFLLRAMEGKADLANKGSITVAELFHYLRTSMAEWAMREGLEQTPMMSASVSADIVLLEDYHESHPIRDALAGHATPEEIRTLTKEFAKLSAIQVWSMMRKEGIYWEGSRFIVKGNALLRTPESDAEQTLFRLLQLAQRRCRVLLDHDEIPAPERYSGDKELLKSEIRRVSNSQPPVDAIEPAESPGMFVVTLLAESEIELAFATVREMHGEFPDGVIHIKTQNGELRDRYLAEIIEPFIPLEDAPPSEPSLLRGRFQFFLSGKRTLILLDDVLPKEHIQSFIPPEGNVLIVLRRGVEQSRPIDESLIAPGSIPNDPWKGVFGGLSERNHRRLTAQVETLQDSFDWFTLTLTVSSTDPKNYPLFGDLRFYLHPTFQPDKPIVSARGDDVRVEYEALSWGAFTVGVDLDGGATRLELDLAEKPDLPHGFRYPLEELFDRAVSNNPGLQENDASILKAIVESLRKELGNNHPTGIIQYLLDLGIRFVRLNDHHKAIEFYEHARAAARKFGDRAAEENTLSHLGITRKRIGDLAGAQDCFEQSLILARGLGSALAEGQAYWNLAQLFDHQAKRETAIEYAEKALQLLRGTQSREVRQFLEELRSPHTTAVSTQREESSEVEAQVSVTETPLVVYLAETARDLEAVRNSIRVELEQRGIKVLPDRNLPDSADPLKEVVRQYLRQAAISIHLIGDRYGVRPDGEERSIPHLQYDLAVETRSQNQLEPLVWMPNGLEPKSEEQKQFVAFMRYSPNFWRGNLEDFKINILEKIQQISSTSIIEEEVQTINVCLLCHEKDVRFVTELINYLRINELFKVTLLTSEEYPSQTYKMYLQEADAVILYYGTADESWFVDMWKQIRRHILRRENPIITKAIYAGPPPTTEKDLLDSDDPMIIRNYNSFTQASISPFIERVRESRRDTQKPYGAIESL